MAEEKFKDSIAYMHVHAQNLGHIFWTLFVYSCREDTQSDYVEFSNFNVELMDRKMRRMCGTNSSTIKHHVLSDGNFFRVTFRSNDAYDATGFEAFYQFRKYEGLLYHVTTTAAAAAIQHYTIVILRTPTSIGGGIIKIIRRGVCLSVCLSVACLHLTRKRKGLGSPKLAEWKANARSKPI